MLTVVVAGVPYTLAAGETRTVPSPAASFPYEMRTGPYVVRGVFEAGRSYSLGVHPPAPP